MHKKDRLRVFYTLAALLPAQLVFFISDTFFETLSKNEGLFSALGWGSLFGVFGGILYRKLPHMSVLTFSFGGGVLLAVLPVVTGFFCT